MSSFKVGDKVVIDPLARINTIGEGNVRFAEKLAAYPYLTVEKLAVTEGGNLRLKELSDEACPTRFKLYVDPTKLKEGDKVRLVTNGGFTSCKAGDIVTVLDASYDNGAIDATHPGFKEAGGLHFFSYEYERIPQEAPVAAPAIVEVAEEPRQDYIIVDCEGDYIDTLRGATLTEAKAFLVEDKSQSSYWPYTLFTKAVTLNLSKNLVEV